MNIDTLSTLVALILAVSLASERLVAIVKSLIPQLRSSQNSTLATEAGTAPSPEGMPGNAKMRRIIVRVIVLGTAWLTSSFFAGEDILSFKSFVGQIPFGSGDDPAKIPVFIMAILASGGSEVWKNILGYTKAVRDIKIGERATNGSGKAGPNERQTSLQMANLGQPDFDSHEPRI